MRIDLSNDAAAAELCKRCLLALDLRLSTDAVHVDTTTSNAARIWKLHGTAARKGDATPERPHRRAQLLDVPDHIEVASREALERLAALVPDEPERAPARNSGRALDVGAWRRAQHRRGAHTTVAGRHALCASGVSVRCRRPRHRRRGVRDSARDFPLLTHDGATQITPAQLDTQLLCGAGGKWIRRY